MPTLEELNKRLKELNQEIAPLEEQLHQLLFEEGDDYEEVLDQIKPLTHERIEVVSWIKLLNKGKN